MYKKISHEAVNIDLEFEPIQDFFKQNNIVYIQADWTRYDPVITDYLAGFGLSGVPAYIFYAPGKEPVVLSSLLSDDMILNLEL